MVVLATIATIIASQAVITGAYSVTRQAIQLGLIPRLTIRHTSEMLHSACQHAFAGWRAAAGRHLPHLGRARVRLWRSGDDHHGRRWSAWIHCYLEGVGLASMMKHKIG